MKKSPNKKVPKATTPNISRVSAEFECFDFANWPANLFPHSGARARQLVRSHRDALVAAGAISRIGREIVVFPKPYVAWLKKHVQAVKDYELPCNAPEVLARRANGHDKAEGKGAVA